MEHLDLGGNFHEQDILKITEKVNEIVDYLNAGTILSNDDERYDSPDGTEAD